MCVELNAHALISFVMTIRDNFNRWCRQGGACGFICTQSMYLCTHPMHVYMYVIWLFTYSLSVARSMTSTFSTVINFGMLGLLRCLHRLQIQANLQAESIETDIIFPQARRHLSKDAMVRVVAKSIHWRRSLMNLYMKL